MSRIVALLLCLWLFPQPASAWGRKGHAAIAVLAESQLTPQARAQVRELLAGDLDREGKRSARMTLAAIASWPDEIRDIAPAKAFKGWHSRANPVCDAALGACRDGHCVDQLIIAYAAVLSDRSQPLRERNEALKWVVHLVGDLHQPLHSGVSIDGGNVRVAVDGVDTRPGTTLHALWDNEIGNLAANMGPLQGGAVAADALPADAPTDWMKEARDVSRRYVYETLPGFACGQRLPAPVGVNHAYLWQGAVTARGQMERAGLRLAQLLNALLRPAPE
jgi:hypothetical protein